MLTFEEKLFGKGKQAKDGWQIHLARLRPDFDRDVREILEDSSLPSYPEEPEAAIGRSMYFHLKKYMESFGLPTEYLSWLSGIGKKADLFYEADGFVFAWINDRPIVITLDAFNLSQKTFRALKDYWLDVFNGCYYDWRALQNDLFRFKRIFSEKRKKLKMAGYSDSEALDTINWWLLSSEFKEMWESGYIVEIPKHFIQRSANRHRNQFVVTPSQVRNRGERRFFAKMLVQYILKEAEKSATST